jgi:hypothetical protein
VGAKKADDLGGVFLEAIREHTAGRGGSIFQP